MPIGQGIYYTLYQGGQKDKPPVVLIHGAGSNHLCWPAELRRLSGFNVLAVDLPGHGRSAGLGQHSIDAYASQLVGFLAGLNINQAYLVGHSMGGAIALSISLQFPTLPVALGLIATAAYLNVSPKLLESLKSPGTYQDGLNWIRQHVFCPHTDATLIEYSMKQLRDLRPATLYEDWLACSHFDLHGEIEQVASPGWVAIGSEDRLIPLSSANYLITSLRQARLQVIQSAGHMLIIEKPKELAQGLHKLLIDLEGGHSI
ncbi:MAG: alpha/beta hydrolase [Anaerolineaceae bacterium]|nr:alpha/beta hydrolase [Anaerolineaceae bacterium]